MYSAPKDSLSRGNGYMVEQRTLENVSDPRAGGKVAIENAYVSEKQKLSESTGNENIPTIDMDVTEADQAPFSTDYDDFIGESSDDPSVSIRSELAEAEKESQRYFDGRKIYACGRDGSNCEEGRRSEMKHQSAQSLCLPEDAIRDEVKILKDKLAINKKDTETMQKLLEDVRIDYEELQKSFDKHASETKIKEGKVLMKESNEMRKQIAEKKRSQKKNKVSSSDEKTESRFSDGKKTSFTRKSSSALQGIDSDEIACPCLVKSVRKIVMDIREDFKDTILDFKQCSAEHYTSIGEELTKLKREYSCAVERRNSEISGFEKITKGLESRLLEANKELVTLRSAFASVSKEKQKLYDDIRLVKDELLRAKFEKEASQADLVKIKQGLKKYCTAEEYEELQKLNFQFDGDFGGRGIDGCGQFSDNIDEYDNIGELRNRVARFYPVLKKAKQEMAKLKEQKQEAENRLEEKVSEAVKLESSLNKQLRESVMELKQKETIITEIKEQLSNAEVKNALINKKINQLEKEKKDLNRKYRQELEEVKSKLRPFSESRQVHKTKSDQLEKGNDLSNDDDAGPKSFPEDKVAKMHAGTTGIEEYSSDDEDSQKRFLQEDSLFKKDLEAEKRKNKLCLLEIEKLKGELDQWKEMVREDMDVGVGFLRIENEDLKDELQENQIFIKELVSKKKLHTRIIKKLRAENASLKNSKGTTEHDYEDVVSFESDDEMFCEGLGYERSTTQEQRVRFDKNGKIGKGAQLPNENKDLHIETSFDFLDTSLGKDFHVDTSFDFLDTSVIEKE